MNISKFKTDLSKESHGTWVPCGDGGQLLVARLNNPKYQALVRKLGKPHARAIRADVADQEIVVDIAKKAAAETILLGWKNIQGEDGKDIKYSPQKAYELFTDLNDFYIMVIEFASDVTLYRLEAKEEAIKNS